MNLIGINGRMHSGKDTAVQYIKQAAGPQCRVQREGFADRMKLSGVRALGFDPPSIEAALEIANAIKEQGTIEIQWDGHGQVITGREFWQRYGTEAHREVFGDPFWVDVLLPINGTINHTFAKWPDADVLVITDVRFPNEAERILDLGGHVWKIDADTRLGPLPPGSHVSEHGLPDEHLTAIIPNNGTLEQFEAAVISTWRLSC
jgi:hypothetical protein